LLASIKNIIGFGLATAAIVYLGRFSGIDLVLKILAGLVILVMGISLSAFIAYVALTIKRIPATLKKNDTEFSFLQIYGYLLKALAVRLLEVGICIFYLVKLYQVF